MLHMCKRSIELVFLAEKIFMAIGKERNSYQTCIFLAIISSF